MKKIVIYAFIFSIIISGCGTHTGAGALTGSQVGSILGSAIGGFSDSRHGRDVGTIAGLVGGAIIGGSVGAASDKANKKKLEDRYRYIDSSEDSYYERPEKRGVKTVDVSQMLEIRNIKFTDSNNDGKLSRGEEAEITFDIYNNTDNTFTGVCPSVKEASSKKCLDISQSISVGNIEPGRAIRYTATLKGNKKARSGHSAISISVYDATKTLISPRTEIQIETNR